VREGVLYNDVRVAMTFHLTAIFTLLSWSPVRAAHYEGGRVADVVIDNHAIDDLLEIQQSSLNPGGECGLACSLSSGFKYGLEWSADLQHWNLFQIFPTTAGAQIIHVFADPGDGRRLFLRVG
jgi:hypothetical protein